MRIGVRIGVRARVVLRKKVLTPSSCRRRVATQMLPRKCCHASASAAPFLIVLQGCSLVSARTLPLLQRLCENAASVIFMLPLAQLSAYCSMAGLDLGLQCARSCGNKTQGSSVVCRD